VAREEVIERATSPFREARPPGPPGPRDADNDLTATLRPLTGFEEEYVEAHQGDANTARLCNEVLARCLAAPGADPGGLLDRVRQLVIAERDRALVRLRQISLGDRVETAVDCPRCAAVNQVDFRLSSLPLDFTPPPERVEVILEDGRAAVLRLPRAGDQEDLLDAGIASTAGRRTWLLARLLVRLGEQEGPFDEDLARALPVRTRHELERAIETHGGFLDLRMAVTCHACGHAFSSPFDVATFFFSS
jgi:hypothetical protein